MTRLPTDKAIQRLLKQKDEEIAQERLETAKALDELFTVVDALLRMPKAKRAALPRTVRKALEWRREQRNKERRELRQRVREDLRRKR